MLPSVRAVLAISGLDIQATYIQTSHPNSLI